MPKTRESLLRHAQSKANVLGVLISNPEEGKRDFGVTEFGRIQVRVSINEAKKRGLGKKKKSSLYFFPISKMYRNCKRSAINCGWNYRS